MGSTQASRCLPARVCMLCGLTRAAACACRSDAARSGLPRVPAKWLAAHAAAGRATATRPACIRMEDHMVLLSTCFAHEIYVTLASARAESRQCMAACANACQRVASTCIKTSFGLYAFLFQTNSNVFAPKFGTRPIRLTPPVRRCP
jgi:hypothetical protein